jgi:NAD+ synthase
MTTMLQPSDVDDEIARLVKLIGTEVGDDPAFLLVSGGLDSDVVARLTARSVGPQRMKLATVLQDEMDPAHLDQARDLAVELSVGLVEIDMRGVNLDVLYRFASADADEGFNPLGLLDPARMKCSLRTVVASSYQDRGYVVIGTSNRTEAELGFFLPFGDGIWHVGPIAHLYKTEIRLVAAALGTARAVLEQPPSAGFWLDQTDREDMGFWMVHQGPIQRERDFTDAEVARAAEFSSRLSEPAVDDLLLAISEGRDPAGSGVPADIATAIAAIVQRSAHLKTRPTGVALARRK